MMQFNMYHHYTVDEHLIRTVGVLADIERGACATTIRCRPSSCRTIDNREALYVAPSCTTSPRGRPRTTRSSARGSRASCPRLGLSAAETETVAWLVEHHLVDDRLRRRAATSTIPRPSATSPTSCRAGAAALLLVLTVADIRAVGPGVWNGWKGQLLRTLYYETEPLLAGGHTQCPRARASPSAQEAGRGARRLAQGRVERFIVAALSRLLAGRSTRSGVEHAKLIRDAERPKSALATDAPPTPSAPSPRSPCWRRTTRACCR